MPHWRQDGPNLLTSTALLGLAGTGAALGAMPGLAPSPLSLIPLAALGAVAWLHQRRDRRIAARLRHLRLSVALPIPPAAMTDHILAFQAAGPGHWQAGRDGWQISIRYTAGNDLPWQLCIHRPAGDAPPSPVATTASMNAMLMLARGLLPGMATQPGQATLLDCDLSFPVRGFSTQNEDRLTALAEGGYALQVAHGYLAIAAEQAELLLRRSDAVPATPR